MVDVSELEPSAVAAQLAILEVLYKEAAEDLRGLHRRLAEVGRDIADTELRLQNISWAIDSARRAAPGRAS